MAWTAPFGKDCTNEDAGQLWSSLSPGSLICRWWGVQGRRLTVCDDNFRGLEKPVELSLGANVDRLARHVVEARETAVKGC